MSTPPPYTRPAPYPPAPAFGATVPVPGPVPAPVSAPGEAPAPTEPGRPARSGRRGLGWGIGGALVASVIWATAVLTVPSLVAPGAAAPGLGAYHVVDNLCGAARLSRFGQLYPTQSGTPYHYSTRHPALDEMYCSEYLKKGAGDSQTASLYLQAQLHKSVDPQPEFEAQRSGLQQRRYEIREVANLGQQAYTGYLDDPGGSDRNWHYLTQVVYVRDGALTYYLSWSSSYQAGKDTPPDQETIRQALLIDTRDVLRALGGQA